MTTLSHAGEVLVSPVAEHPQHFSDLDGLRGLLALSIVLYHYGINAIILRATGGHATGFVFDLSVDFFFLLSGYVLAYSMRKGTPSVWAFAVKRAFRLLPVYFVTFCLMVAMLPWASPNVPFLAHTPTAWGIVSDLFLVAPMVDVAQLNVPSWSVTYEFFLPIAAILVAAVIGKTVRAYSVPLIIVAGLGLSYTGCLVAAGGHYYGFRALFGLAGGCGLYLAMLRFAFPAGLCTPTAMYGLIAGMLAVMFLSGWVSQIAAFFPWIAILTIAAGTRTRTALSSWPMAALGHLSYTLYMVHIPVLVASALTFGSLSGNFFIKAGTMIAALVAAGLLTVLIERPAMRLGVALAKR